MLPKTAFLAVSLFKPELEGRLLQSHLLLIERDDRFDSLIIALGDTLFEHNLKRSVPDHAARIALGGRYGQEWLMRNQPAFAVVQKSCRLLRFDQQKRIPGFWANFSSLAKLFESGPFRTALNLDVAAFEEREMSRGARPSTADSVDYILEELAADIAFARQQPFTHIYPGKPLNSYLAMINYASLLPARLRGLETCSFLRTRADISRGKVRFAGMPCNEQPESIGVSNAM